MTWVCPHCKRTFASEAQFHSHDVVDLEGHFAGRPPELGAAFNKLVASLPSDVRLDPLKTAIILAARTTFSFVIVRAARLSVGIFLDRPLDSPRVSKVDQISSRKIANVVEVYGPGDIDHELRSWLLEAYRLRSGPPVADSGSERSSPQAGHALVAPTADGARRARRRA